MGIASHSSPKMRGLGIWGLGIWVAAIAGGLAPGVRLAADEAFFETHIRPLFAEHCVACHGDEQAESGLRLSSREALLEGGELGPAVAPGDPAASLLIQAVRYLDDLQMPPDGKLSAGAIARLEQWVAMGAPWPASSAAPPSTPSPGDERPTGPTEKHRTWWAFQPVRQPTPPAVRAVEWARTEIDRFVLAELEKRGMQPAPPASKRTLLRRVTFDLTGLPPTRAEIAAFLADESSEAYARVVDRLLASPDYGRRWARHWLDVVRYADYHDPDPAMRTPGSDTHEAWRYRDWVVDAFNRDLPYDAFIVHQIAGDRLPDPEGREYYADGLVATTFLSNGAWDRGDADKEKMVSDMVDDNVDTVGKAFLGLTLGCARCHDHKFDPVSQEDYYGLAGMFYSSHLLADLGAKGGEYTLNRTPLAPAEEVRIWREKTEALQQVKQQLEELDKRSPKPAEDDPERQALVALRDQRQAELPPDPPLAMAVADGGTPGGLFPGIQDVPIHLRGSYTRLGKVVARRMPVFFAGDEQPPIASGSGRLELARWVASAANPLTARVLVNRVWQGHFGEGLVRTPNNFGLLSEPPSHPELLDWLAHRFMDEGWSLKRLHRAMVLSAVYQQAADAPPAQYEQDPENRWLGRFAARRLEAEAIRDAMLTASDRLDRRAGGPAGADLAEPRRSLYVQTARWGRSDFATLFDAANPDAASEKRIVSTVAPQALFLLNHPFAVDQARLLAERLQRDEPGTDSKATARRIDLAFELLYGRPANAEELQLGGELIARLETESGPEQSWADFAHVMLCSNEFVYLD